MPLNFDYIFERFLLKVIGEFDSIQIYWINTRCMFYTIKRYNHLCLKAGKKPLMQNFKFV